METISYQTVLQALQISHTTINNQQIRRATHMIQLQSNKEGYIAILLTIINDSNNHQNLIYAALLQLKNVLRYRWTISNIPQSKGKNPIPQKDQLYLINCLIQTNINHSLNHTMFTIIKDINQRVGDSAHHLMPAICQLLQKEQQLKACLNILLGIAEYYRFQTSYVKKLMFISFLEAVVPLVLSLVHKGQQKIVGLYWEWHNSQSMDVLRIFNTEKAAFQEILYMSIKFAYKSICAEFPPSLRKMFCEWALIAQSRLDEENQEYNQSAKKHPNNCGKRGTNQFNYFHAKKWSAKFFSKFISKLMVNKKSQPQLAKITEDFYEHNGESLKLTLHSIFKQFKPNHVRFFQLNLLETIFTHKPKLIKNQLDYYLFQVLPNILSVSDQDLKNLQQNPQEFIINQSYTEKNTKTYATNIWCNLALFESIRIMNFKGQVKEGYYIIESFKQIKKWLFSQDWRSKQIALYLMNSIGLKITQFPQSTQLARQLLSMCLPHIFDQPLLILQVRGFQLILNYSSIIDKSLYPDMQNIILNVFEQRSQVSNLDLLAIYAGMALEKVIYYGVQTIRTFSLQQIKLILSTLLQLIKLYELSQLSRTLVIMIEQYSEEMSVFSIELVRFMCKIVKQIIDKSIQLGKYQFNSYNDSVFDVLFIMTRITTEDHNFTLRLRQTLEEQIIYLLNYLLTYQQELSQDYLQVLLQILSSFINSQTNIVPTLPNPINFYFTIIVFKLAPPSINLLENVQRSSFTQQQKLLIKQCKKDDDISLQVVFQLFRNYLKFINPNQVNLFKNTTEIQEHLFDSDILNQLMYLLYYFYKNSQTLDSSSQCKGRYLVTMLLTCILEHHQNSLPFLFYAKIFAVIKVNEKCKKLKKYLKRNNLQLFCIWLCCYQDAINIIYKNTQVGVDFIMNIFLSNKQQLNSIDNQLQRKRIILGMVKLIRFGFVHSELKTLYEFLFTWVFYYISKILVGNQEDDQNGLFHTVTSAQQKQQVEQNQNYSLFYDNNQLQEIIDQSTNEYYFCKNSFHQLDFFLQTLLHLQQQRNEDYYNYVIKCHYYSLKTIYKAANLDYVMKYKDLLNENGHQINDS